MKAAALALVATSLGAGLAPTRAEPPMPAEIRVQASIVGRVYADSRGLSLYAEMLTSKPGEVNCRHSTSDDYTEGRIKYDCLAIFHPVRPSNRAEAVGEWSIIIRPDDGARQWAFRHYPVYTSAFDSRAGSVNGTGNELQVLQLPLAAPVGIASRASRYGEILINHRGLALYAMRDDGRSAADSACASRCVSRWPPVYAPAMATPIGDFDVVTREDGTKQWRYKGRPLHTYAGDTNPGDATGDGLQNWHTVVVQTKEPPPRGISVTDTVFGKVYANSQGRTLYFYAGIYPSEDGKPVRDLRTVKNLCTDHCAKLWQSVIVTADTPLSISWSMLDLPDGTKQLAYRGRPLYTYVADKEAGDIEGNRYGRHPGEWFQPVLAYELPMRGT